MTPGTLKSASIFLLLIALLALSAELLAVQEHIGRVVGVHDGDTITLLTLEKRQIKVRLAEIDTPESKQPYGSRAKQALSDKVFGKTVTVKQETIDRYGRMVGHVYLDSRDINREMVREGYAWVYRQYAKDRSLLDEERAAREAKRGLWSLPQSERTPPWEWRRAKRGGRSTSTPQTLPAAATGSFTCGAKRTCGAMSSCTEARFYLKQCGLTRLDSDRDGRPCEALCR